jgi:hypothetical protein
MSVLYLIPRECEIMLTMSAQFVCQIRDACNNKLHICEAYCFNSCRFSGGDFYYYWHVA